ncbi:MAG: hypothetical protein J6Y85_01075 [Alphaproteobacteria bacterium]|nr:hypothetical protein [Alphaproteobacteria bacterium]
MSKKNANNRLVKNLYLANKICVAMALLAWVGAAVGFTKGHEKSAKLALLGAVGCSVVGTACAFSADRADILRKKRKCQGRG